MTLKQRIDALVTRISQEFAKIWNTGIGSASLATDNVVSDANSAVKTGYYRLSTGTNAPNGSQYGAIMVVANESNQITQVYFPIYANSSLWFRVCWLGTWQPWQRIYNDVIDKLTLELNKIYSNEGNPSFEELALVHSQMANKLRFVVPDLQEQSDDGVNWTTSTRATANQLADLMIGEGQGVYYDTTIIPNPTVGSSGHYRLTWNYNGTYKVLNSVYINLCTSGENVTVKIEGYKSNTNWVTLAENTINNYPGHVYCKHDQLRFIDSSSWGDWYSKIRISFSLVNSQVAYDNVTVGTIEWFGYFPSGRRNVEYYDRLKNVFFPNQINGTGANFTGAAAEVNVTGVTAEPSAAASAVLKLFSKSFAGKQMLCSRNYGDLSNPLQSAMFGVSIYKWFQSTATAGTWLGTTGSTAGTFALALPTGSSDPFTSSKKSTYSNVVTTTNQVLGVRGTENLVARGSGNSAGGFFFHARCGFSVWTSGGRFFAGLTAAGTTVITAEPSAKTNAVGFCIDSTDGTISIMTRGASTGTKNALWTFAAGDLLDLYLYCAPNDTNIYYTAKRINTTGITVYNGTLSTNQPVNTGFMAPHVLASNAALTPVNSITLAVMSIYLETNY